jgi:hypothetical protein
LKTILPQLKEKDTIEVFAKEFYNRHILTTHGGLNKFTSSLMKQHEEKPFKNLRGVTAHVRQLFHEYDLDAVFENYVDAICALYGNNNALEAENILMAMLEKQWIEGWYKDITSAERA